MKIGIVMGTIRENRKSKDVAEFILKTSKRLKYDDVEFEIIDLKEYNLPLFAESLPPAATDERETKEGRSWVNKIDSMDAFIFVTGEYNRSIPGALKNATDHIGLELRNKAGAITSYGVTGGNSAVDHLRLVLSRLGLMLVRNQPYFFIKNDFDNDKLLDTSKDKAIKQVRTMLEATIKLAKQL